MKNRGKGKEKRWKMGERHLKSGVFPRLPGELLARYGARFLRLPPFLLLHLERFRTGSDGLPDRVSRKCQMDLNLELEEARFKLKAPILAPFLAKNHSKRGENGPFEGVRGECSGRATCEGHELHLAHRVLPAAGRDVPLRRGPRRPRHHPKPRISHVFTIFYTLFACFCHVF